MITRRNFIVGFAAVASASAVSEVQARPIRARSRAWGEGIKAFRAGAKLSDNPEVGYREAWAEGWEWAKWYDGLTPEERATYDEKQKQDMKELSDRYSHGIQTIFTLGGLAVVGMIGFTIWLVKNT